MRDWERNNRSEAFQPVAIDLDCFGAELVIGPATSGPDPLAPRMTNPSVIASDSEAIQIFELRALDCFVACASRNDE